MNEWVHFSQLKYIEIQDYRWDSDLKTSHRTTSKYTRNMIFSVFHLNKLIVSIVPLFWMKIFLFVNHSRVILILSLLKYRFILKPYLLSLLLLLLLYISAIFTSIFLILSKFNQLVLQPSVPPFFFPLSSPHHFSLHHAHCIKKIRLRGVGRLAGRLGSVLRYDDWESVRVVDRSPCSDSDRFNPSSPLRYPFHRPSLLRIHHNYNQRVF